MRKVPILVLAVASTFLLERAMPSMAATFTVDSTLDLEDIAAGDGSCSTLEGRCPLRAAVQEANALPGEDIIVLPAGTFEIDTVTGGGEDASSSGDLDVSSILRIEGAGADVTIIAAGGDGTPADRVLHVLGSGALTLLDVTVRGGRAEGGATRQGGGMLNEGIADLSGCVIADNRANQGAGIFNLGGLLVDSCTFSANELVDAGLVESGSALRQGLDGADGATAEILNSTFSDNSGVQSAGVIQVVRSGAFAMENSTVSSSAIEGVDLIGTPAVIHHVTIVASGASGLSFSSSAGFDLLTLWNSIIGASGATACNFSNVTPLQTGNLASDASCSAALSGPLQLGALADNGGPTWTHLPAATSPAVDNAEPGVCLDEDQRGVPRPDGGMVGACDIGAVELLPEPRTVALGMAALLAVGALARRRA